MSDFGGGGAPLAGSPVIETATINKEASSGNRGGNRSGNRNGGGAVASGSKESSGNRSGGGALVSGSKENRSSRHRNSRLNPRSKEWKPATNRTANPGTAADISGAQLHSVNPHPPEAGPLVANGRSADVLSPVQQSANRARTPKEPRTTTARPRGQSSAQATAAQSPGPSRPQYYTPRHPRVTDQSSGGRLPDRGISASMGQNIQSPQGHDSSLDSQPVGLTLSASMPFLTTTALPAPQAGGHTYGPQQQQQQSQQQQLQLIGQASAPGPRDVGFPQAAVVIDPVPPEIQILRSAKLNKLTSGPGNRPTYQQAVHPDFFPFQLNIDICGPVTYGVVKIKNIPFTTKRSEIIAFLGRNSKILSDHMEPIHIVMDRVTSKTNDVYVEFMSMLDATRVVEKHTETLSKGRLSRLGDRPVEVELSSQATLMGDLFPQAKGLYWNGSAPQILDPNPDEPWDDFKGFVTEEEMALLVKHVEIPSRSPYAKDCPQRPFESMISTLKKMPWYRAECITMRQRHAIHRAVTDLIRLLQMAIRDRRTPEVLNEHLLKRLATAAMLCPGLSVTMKDDVSYLVGLSEKQEREFCQPRFADAWRHAYVLSPKPGYPLDLLEWYIAIIREETNHRVLLQQPGSRMRVQALGAKTDGYWGYFWHEVGLPSGQAFDEMNLREAADRELAALERVLYYALGH